MKYIVIIGFTALLVGLSLSLGGYWLLGENPGMFFVKFIATPVGLAVSLGFFLLYDTLWPKNANKHRRGRKR